MNVQRQIYYSVIQYSPVCLCIAINVNLKHDRLGVIRTYLLKSAARKLSDYLHVNIRKVADNYLLEESTTSTN